MAQSAIRSAHARVPDPPRLKKAGRPSKAPANIVGQTSQVMNFVAASGHSNKPARMLPPRVAQLGDGRDCLANGTSLCQAAGDREETNLLNLGGSSWPAAMIFKVVIGVARETPVALLG